MNIKNHIGFRPDKENLKALRAIALAQQWRKNRGAKSRFINEAIANHIKRTATV